MKVTLVHPLFSVSADFNLHSISPFCDFVDFTTLLFGHETSRLSPNLVVPEMRQEFGLNVQSWAGGSPFGTFHVTFE
jgi:hypothetical protein